MLEMLPYSEPVDLRGEALMAILAFGVITLLLNLVAFVWPICQRKIVELIRSASRHRSHRSGPL